LRRLNPDSVETRTLGFLVEERRKLVNERGRFAQRLNAHLKLYFPQVLNWFCDISSQIAVHFLELWPTLQTVDKAKTKHSNVPLPITIVVVPKKIKTRVAEIRRAVAVTHDDERLLRPLLH
jgi:hypothetical protein